MNVVDSSAWLAYLADEQNANFFAGAIEDTELLIVPSVCIYEVFKVVLREKGEEDALQAIAVMRQGIVVDLNQELAMEAAALGIEEKLPFADSIIYAIARKYNAIVWTQDEHFSGKSDVQFKAKPRKS